MNQPKEIGVDRKVIKKSQITTCMTTEGHINTDAYTHLDVLALVGTLCLGGPDM
jgi:hypothetical protein